MSSPVHGAPALAGADDRAVAPGACVTIGGLACRVLCVDDVLPQLHPTTRQQARGRMSYASGELAHFELEGHRYALVRETIAPAPDPDADLDALSDIHRLLTNREMQIVQLICMGCLTKQAADRLHISEFTVRSYLKTIYCKLGVRSRGAMVYRYAQALNRASSRGA
jgi:DNA-binding NarL/FixJ family response regulator